MSNEDKIPSKLRLTLECKQGALRAVKFNVDGNYCLTCGSDKTVKLWNPHKGLFLKTYSGHNSDVLDAQASCDSAQLCTCGMDKNVILWDVATAKSVRKYRGHAATVNCVTFNEEGTLILSGSLDGTVKIWDTKSRSYEPVQVLDEAKDSVTAIMVSDYEILTGSADGRIRRYDIRNGQMHLDVVGHPITSARFTKDSQCKLVSCLDNTLRLFDKESGELLNEFTGHKNKEYKIDNSLSSDDMFVLSGSEDGSVYIWDLVSAKVVKKIEHQGANVVHALSYHPSEVNLLTAVGNKMFMWGSPHSPIVV